MQDMFPNFNVDGYVPILCTALTVSSQPDYRGTVVVLTCDGWFSNGLDVFQGSQRNALAVATRGLDIWVTSSIDSYNSTR